MNCPQCQFENREGAKFCKECGAKLDLTCPQCGYILSPESKFCDECGYPLIPSAKSAPKELSFDEKLTKIQKYLPKGLTEKILSQKDRIEGERKPVTVMFCDMEGFTPLSEQLGPEEAYSIMDKVYEILIHKVHHYGGTVNEMTGDGIMALFGAPIALEDAPQRAIRSSLAIHREMVKFSNQLQQERKDIPSLKMRIGLHTGPVVVGTLGNDLRVEFKAVGDTVNLASRIEGLAKAGTTWVSEETFKLTEGFFRFEVLGKRKIKGKQVPVNVYQIIAPSTRRTRFDVSTAIGLTPFVGRERVLEILIDSFARAKTGRGQAVSIVAEAGVGKSRLLYEFRKAVSIPSTIQDVIMARVDSLSEGAKEVLQNGSLIEREFGYALIKHVTGLPEPELLTHLSVLKDAELLYERGIYPQSTYIFKHALTREVVHDSILTQRKKKLHEVIGNAIEQLYIENIGEYSGVLVEHFIESENFEKAAEHSKVAGKKAQKAASFKDAIEYARKAIYCLERLPETGTTQKKIIDARTRLAGYYLSLDHYVDAKEAVAPIADLALELKYQKRLPIIYTVLGTFSQWVEEDYSKAFRYLDQAFKISEKVKDDTSLWFASFFLGIARSLHCEFEKGIEYFSKSLDLAESANNPIMIAFAKSLMSTFNYIFYGKADFAYQLSQESLRMAQESGDIYLKGMAYSSYGMACYGMGLFDEAESSLLHALPLCEKTALLGWGTWGTGFLGHTYVDQGKYNRALAIYKRGISILEPAKLFPFWINLWKIAIARLKVFSNDRDIDLRKVFDHYRNINVKAAKGWAARYVAEILLNMDNRHFSEAEDWARKALEADESNGTMWSLACDHVVYAELCKRKGDSKKARENLNKAIEIFTECGAEGWQNKAEEEMAALS